jgi:hypothetical protein
MTRCPPGYYYNDETRSYSPYVAIEVTGPNRTHDITSGEGWRQKYHPSERTRMAGCEGRFVKGDQKPVREKRKYSFKNSRYKKACGTQGCTMTVWKSDLCWRCRQGRKVA